MSTQIQKLQYMIGLTILYRMESRDATIRLIIERTIAYGRMRKSSQSGWLQYHNGTAEDAHHDTIPVYDNFLFALALLRSRSIDNINEAKEFIEKLLHFQIGAPHIDAGAFPIYLHDLPSAKDRYLSVFIGLVMTYILRDFGHVIGQDFRDKLRNALKALMHYVEEIHTQTPPPFHLLVSRAALLVTAGKELEDSEMTSRGMTMMDALDKTPNPSWYVPKILGQILNALTMVYPSLQISPWKELWTFADRAWHRATGSYVGPPICQWQVREEPQVTLYDYFMSAQTGVISRRATRESHITLEAAVIHPMETESSSLDVAGEYRGEGWVMMKNSTMAYAGFDGKPEAVQHNLEKGFHNFVMVWGNLERTHTMACQRVRMGDVVCKPEKAGATLEFSLEGGAFEEDRERNREIVVAMDRTGVSTFTVNGENAMIFNVGDTLVVDGQIRLVFEVIQGEGKFLGHRMPGNRWAQVGVGESNAFEAYDWLMFLRTVHRTAPCKIALRIEKIG